MHYKHNRQNDRSRNYKNYQNNHSSRDHKYRQHSNKYDFARSHRSSNYDSESQFNYNKKQNKSFQKDDQNNQRKKQERIAKLRLLQFDQEYKDLIKPKKEKQSISLENKKYIQEELNHEDIVDKLKKDLQKKIETKQENENKPSENKQLSEYSLKFDFDQKNETENGSLLQDDKEDPLDYFFSTIDQNIKQQDFNIANEGCMQNKQLKQNNVQYITENELKEQLEKNEGILKRLK